MLLQLQGRPAWGAWYLFMGALSHRITLPSQMKIFVGCYSCNLKKKMTPTLPPFPLRPGLSECFLSSPNVNGKEIKLLQASLRS